MNNPKDILSGTPFVETGDSITDTNYLLRIIDEYLLLDIPMKREYAVAVSSIFPTLSNVRTLLNAASIIGGLHKMGYYRHMSAIITSNYNCFTKVLELIRGENGTEEEYSIANKWLSYDEAINDTFKQFMKTYNPGDVYVG